MSRRNAKKWVKRHTGKHLCHCGCGEYITVTENHYKTKRVPKFIKGHNFSSDYNPKITDVTSKLEEDSSIWGMLSEKEKERRIANLKKFKPMEKHPGWKGGRVYDEVGYVHIRCPDHPFASSGYVLEHRLVMEKHLREQYPEHPLLINIKGEKYLHPNVVVHHINEKKDDNTVTNLFPFPDSAAHIFWHKSPLPDSEKIRRIKLGLYHSDDVTTDDKENK